MSIIKGVEIKALIFPNSSTNEKSNPVNHDDFINKLTDFIEENGWEMIAFSQNIEESDSH